MALELQCASRTVGGALAGPLRRGLRYSFSGVPVPLAHTAHAAPVDPRGDGGFFKWGEGEGAVRRRLGNVRPWQYAGAVAVCAGRSGGLIEVSAAWERAPAGSAVGAHW